MNRPGGFRLILSPTARRGTYRVIYRIDQTAGTIIVLDIAHRRDAYRIHWPKGRSAATSPMN